MEIDSNPICRHFRTAHEAASSFGASSTQIQRVHKAANGTVDTMTKELTVENMFATETVTVDRLIDGKGLTARDRRRMIEHIVADVAHQLLAQPGTNPIGVTVTVSLDEVLQNGTTVRVRGTAPKYELSDAYFD